MTVKLQSSQRFVCSSHLARGDNLRQLQVPLLLSTPPGEGQRLGGAVVVPRAHWAVGHVIRGVNRTLRYFTSALTVFKHSK